MKAECAVLLEIKVATIPEEAAVKTIFLLSHIGKYLGGKWFANSPRSIKNAHLSHVLHYIHENETRTQQTLKHTWIFEERIS